MEDTDQFPVAWNLTEFREQLIELVSISAGAVGGIFSKLRKRGKYAEMCVFV